MRILRSCILVIIFFLGSSCSTPLPDNMPDLGVNIDTLELNTNIHVTALNDCNTFKPGKEVCLQVENFSNKDWVIDITKDILIFQYKDNQWRQVSNNTRYIGAIELILSAKGSFPFDQQFPSILPAVKNDEPANLRIFVIAHERHFEGQGQSTAAYVDMSLR